MRYECFTCDWDGEEDELAGECCPYCGSDDVDLYTFDLGELIEEEDE